MSTIKDLKQAQKAANEQQNVLKELERIVGDIERCEKIMTSLRNELETANAKFPPPRSTRDDVDYLTVLLECAKKKLAWEKQLASMQKRTPTVLQNMTAMLHDPKNPPAEEIRAKMLSSLQQIQAAMERLQKVSPS